MINKCVILASRKTEYKSLLDEKVKEGKCKDCGELILYGDITFRHAKAEQKRRKAESIDFICAQCYKKMPKMGKVIRPNQEMIDKLRAEGIPLDEINIREMMHKIKHKRY